jgi:hypothetical protein
MSKATDKTETAGTPQHKYHLKYDSLTAVYADHVILNGTNGGVMLDFASCVVNDPNTGESTVPVHTRVAMTTNGAAQLFRLLQNVFAPQAQAQGDAAAPAEGGDDK